MSNRSPYWQNSDQTREIPSSNIPGVQQSRSSVQGAAPRGEDKGPAVIAGLFNAKRTTVNLAVLAGLCATITFAVVIVVDRILGGITGSIPQSVSEVVVTALIAGAVGVAVGLLYIPVVGTGNEELFGTAIIALAIAASVVWVIFGGLLDGDWTTLTMLATIICIASTAYAAPPRIEAARIH